MSHLMPLVALGVEASQSHMAGFKCNGLTDGETPTLQPRNYFLWLSQLHYGVNSGQESVYALTLTTWQYSTFSVQRQPKIHW